MTSNSHATAMYATKRRRRNSKNVRTVCSKDSHSKSNPSKRHRERLNQELDMLASLLPFEQNVLSKLDKLSILRLSVSYLRTKSYFQAALASTRLLSNQAPGNHQQPGYGNQFGNGQDPSTGANQLLGHRQQPQQAYPLEMQMEGDLIVKALNGFLLILTCDGEVFYTSHTVETYLGFHQSDICHQSVYELVHSEDREELMQQLKWNSLILQQPQQQQQHPMGLAASRPASQMSLQEILASPDHRHLLERNFTVRFRCLLDNTSGFLRLDIRGRIKVLHGQQNQHNLANSASGNSSVSKGKQQPGFNGNQDLAGQQTGASFGSQPASAKEPMLAFFGVCIPFGPPSLLEMPSKDSVFKSKHRLDLSIISMDSKGKQLLGLNDFMSSLYKQQQAGCLAKGAGQTASSTASSPTAVASNTGTIQVVKMEGQSHGAKSATSQSGSTSALASNSTKINQANAISAYDLVHQDDLSYMASAHQELLKTGASGLIAYRMITHHSADHSVEAEVNGREQQESKAKAAPNLFKYQWLQTSAKLYYKNSKPDFILCTHRPLMEEEGRDLLGKRTMDFKVTYLDVGLSSINDRILACDKFSSLQALGGGSSSSSPGGPGGSLPGRLGPGQKVSNSPPGTNCAINESSSFSSSGSSASSARSLASLSPQLNELGELPAKQAGAKKRKSYLYDLNCFANAPDQFNQPEGEAFEQQHYKRSLEASNVFYDMDSAVAPESAPRKAKAKSSKQGANCKHQGTGPKQARKQSKLDPADAKLAQQGHQVDHYQQHYQQQHQHHQQQQQQQQYGQMQTDNADYQTHHHPASISAVYAAASAYQNHPYQASSLAAAAAASSGHHYANQSQSETQAGNYHASATSNPTMTSGSLHHSLDASYQTNYHHQSSYHQHSGAAEHLLHHYSARSAAALAAWPASAAGTAQPADYHNQATSGYAGQHQTSISGSAASDWGAATAAVTAAAAAAAALAANQSLQEGAKSISYSPTSNQQHLQHQSEQLGYQQQLNYQQVHQPGGGSHLHSHSESVSPSNKSPSGGAQRYSSLSVQQLPKSSGASLNSDGSSHRSPLSSGESSNGSLAAAAAAVAMASADGSSSAALASSYYLAGASGQHDSSHHNSLQNQQQQQQQHYVPTHYGGHNQQLAAYHHHQNPYAVHQYAAADPASVAHYNHSSHYHHHHHQHQLANGATAAIESHHQVAAAAYFNQHHHHQAGQNHVDVTGASGQANSSSSSAAMVNAVKFYSANGKLAADLIEDERFEVQHGLSENSCAQSNNNISPHDNIINWSFNGEYAYGNLNLMSQHPTSSLREMIEIEGKDLKSDLNREQEKTWSLIVAKPTGINSNLEANQEKQESNDASGQEFQEMGESQAGSSSSKCPQLLTVIQDDEKLDSGTKDPLAQLISSTIGDITLDLGNL